LCSVYTGDVQVSHEAEGKDTSELKTNTMTTTTMTTLLLKEQDTTKYLQVEKDTTTTLGTENPGEKSGKSVKRGKNEVRFCTEATVIASETQETIVLADDVNLT